MDVHVHQKLWDIMGTCPWPGIHRRGDLKGSEGQPHVDWPMVPYVPGSIWDGFNPTHAMVTLGVVIGFAA